MTSFFQRTIWFVIGLLGICCPLVVTGAAIAAESEQQALVTESDAVVKTFIKDPDMWYLNDNIKNARGLMIIPALYKGAFFIGGSGGKAILLERDPKTGKWNGPAFYTIGGASFGLQFGGQKAQIIMLISSQRGIESLYTSNFKLGGAVSVAAGPVGAGAEAATPVNLADFISWSYAQGAFVGISLDGSVIAVNDDDNTAYYGKAGLRPVGILGQGGAYNPHSQRLIDTLSRLSK
jgi:lipid-binding SYLF domain-containing protein